MGFVLQRQLRLIADGKTIKEFDFQQRSVEVVSEGFTQAFDVALSAGGDLGVTDVQAHKFFVMKKKQNGRYCLQNTIGTGTTGCSDGPSSKAELPEPNGLWFDSNSAIIYCFGGFKNGYIKLYSTVDFSCKFMAAIRQIYHVIGFLPKKSHNQLAQAGKNPSMLFAEGIKQLQDSLNYLESITTQRRKYLNMATAGPEGNIYHITVEGLAHTVKALKTHIKSLEFLGMQDALDCFNLYAFVNELRKEHGFAKHKQKGQYRLPTLQQYAHSEGCHEIELIKKICKCPHDYHTNSFTRYQPTHQSSLSSVETIVQYKKWSERFRSQQTSSTNETKEDLKVARMLNILTKSRPTRNIRDLYRYKCGFGPCVIIQRDTLLQDDVNPSHVHFPAFDELMRELQIQRSRNDALLDNGRIQLDEYLFVPGDIVAVNPGTDNGIPTGDKWWLLQINKPHHCAKNRPGCHVFGFWLAEKDSTNLSEPGKHFSLLSQSVKIHFGTVIKDDKKIPLVIPVEKLSSGWQNGYVVYVIAEEYCRTQDSMSDSFRKDLGRMNLNDENGNGDVGSESNEEDEEQTEIHEMELTALRRRRRTVRNAEGQILASYQALLNPYRTTRNRRGFSSTEFEADKSVVEFEVPV